ncbi:MAG: S8/S53 family peptidase [Nocardioidaceae bacterium]|nr:S8/S53 family peptidase [Nocardioidaceae bacterium]
MTSEREGKGDGEGRRRGRKIPRRPNQNPRSPRTDVLARFKARGLDPGTALSVDGVSPRSTLYVGPQLVASAAHDNGDLLERLSGIAGELGWELAIDDQFASSRVTRTAPEKRQLGVSRFRLSVKPATASTVPDAWALLQRARARFGLPALQGVGLDHLLFPTPIMSNPHYDSNPRYDSNPHYDSNPIASYGRPGSGGRQPVAYAGPPPHRRSDEEMEGLRPVVGILDTGCGDHPWLTGVVQEGVTLDGKTIGQSAPATDPEVHGDLVGPLTGVIDELSGHGTFIAGLVHQACPDADILSWRIVNSEGPIVESELIKALTQIAELVQRAADGEPGGRRIDVLNLSMGYYHEADEDPDEVLFDPTMRDLLELIGRCGTVVVCSAGNDATERPLYPAAFAPRRGGGRAAAEDRVPVVSVGALNPNRTVAMFSNTGGWVNTYERGASVLSTIPPFEGGLEPVARWTADGKTRETIDPDDFTGGFALWSGTSFAAPLVAGRIAAKMLDDMPSRHRQEKKSEAVERARKAVAGLLESSP